MSRKNPTAGLRVVGDPAGAPFRPRSFSPVRVVVVDDHVLVGRLVVGLLERAGYSAAHVLGGSLEETWREIEGRSPRLVLLDFDLGPTQSAMELLELCRAGGVQVAGFTASDDSIEHALFLESGASAVMSKGGGPAELVALVELAMGGVELMSPAERHEALTRLRLHREACRRELAPFTRLTAREGEALVLIAEGRGAADIAACWEVSLPTVRSHIRAVLTKLGVTSQLQAAAMARDSGWYAIMGDEASSILTMPAGREAGTIARRSGSQG